MQVLLVPEDIDRAASAWLGLIPVIFALFLGWLLIFALAWIFPHAWKRIGIITGILWGLGPVIALIGQGRSGLMALVAAFWGWASLPFTMAAGAIGLGTNDMGTVLFSVVSGLILGIISAWTGNFFRLFV